MPKDTAPPTPRRAMLPTLALVVILLLTGVVALLIGWDGGSRAASDSDPLVGPEYYASPQAVCGLLTAEDVELALGYPYQEGIDPGIYPVFSRIAGITRCGYLPAAQAGEHEVRPVFLGVVYAYAEQVFEDAKQRAEDMTESGEGEVINVEDVGTDAFWDPVAAHLLVLVDDKLVGVHVPASHGEPVEQRVERARRLAEKAIGRLR